MTEREATAILKNIVKDETASLQGREVTNGLTFKGTCSLNSKKPVSAAKAIICGLSNSMGRPLQITDSGKPIQIHKWKFSRWKLVLWFVAALGFPLLTDNGNWRTATNSFELQQEAYSHCQHNNDKPISAISCLAYRYQ